MRIGFDISQTGDLKAGCGYFAQELIKALISLDQENEYVLYPAFGTRFWDPRHAHTTWRTTQATVRRGPEGMSHEECTALWSAARADLEPGIGWPDVVHANNYYCPHGLRSRIVYTVYDTIAFDHPDYLTEANRLVCADGLLDAAVNADLLIAISEATRTRFLDLFPHYPASRVRTVYPGSRFTPGQTSGRLPHGLAAGGFWLTVGTIEPRKNLRRLAQAYAAVCREFPDTAPLVIVGGEGWLEAGFQPFIEDLGIAARVHKLGYVTDTQLAALYAHCFAFVYPALVEGFGLPVVEAMSVGAPVVTSNRSSLPEVVGDAGLAVDPEDVGALASAMRQLLVEPSLTRRLREQGPARARLFSWESAARTVLDLYREVRERPAFVEEESAA